MSHADPRASIPTCVTRRPACTLPRSADIQTVYSASTSWDIPGSFWRDAVPPTNKPMVEADIGYFGYDAACLAQCGEKMPGAAAAVASGRRLRHHIAGARNA